MVARPTRAYGSCFMSCRATTALYALAAAAQSFLISCMVPADAHAAVLSHPVNLPPRCDGMAGNSGVVSRCASTMGRQSRVRAEEAESVWAVWAALQGLLEPVDGLLVVPALLRDAGEAQVALRVLRQLLQHRLHSRSTVSSLCSSLCAALILGHQRKRCCSTTSKLNTEPCVQNQRAHACSSVDQIVG